MDLVNTWVRSQREFHLQGWQHSLEVFSPFMNFLLHYVPRYSDYFIYLLGFILFYVLNFMFNFANAATDDKNEVGISIRYESTYLL